MECTSTPSLDVVRRPTLDNGGIETKRFRCGMLPLTPPNASRFRREESTLGDPSSSSAGGTKAGPQSDARAQRKETLHRDPPLLLTQQGWVKWDWKSARFKA